MKIDRLIGILSILLQKEKVTAPELAQVFEVSKRTINRDIDDLCRAGIPIVTSQGTGGGIERVFPSKGKVKAIFDESMKWHLIEEYGIESFTELSDGKLLFEHDYADDDGLLSWILTMKDKVTVLEPDAIRQKLFCIATEIAEKYRKESVK